MTHPILVLTTLVVLVASGCARPLGVWSGDPPEDGGVLRDAADLPDSAHFPDGFVPPDATVPPDPPCTDLTGLDEGSPWPTFRRCQSRAGRSPYPGPSSGTVAWSVPVNGGLEGLAILADGTVIGPGDSPYSVWMLDPATGERIRSIEASRDGVAYTGHPVLLQGGMVVLPFAGGIEIRDLWGELLGRFGGDPEGIHINPGSPLVRGSRLTMTQQSSFPSPPAMSFSLLSFEIPALLGDPGFAYSTTPVLSDGMFGFPAFGPGGGTYVSQLLVDLQHETWQLIRVGEDDGATVLFETERRISQIPVVASDGTTYVAIEFEDELRGKVVGVDLEGRVTLEILRSTYLPIGVTLGEDGAIHIIDSSSYSPFHLRCHEPDGTLRWEAPLPEAPSAHPVVDGEGVVYVGGFDSVVAIDAQGAPRWTVRVMGSGLVRTMALGADRRLFVLKHERLYAIGP